jgi:hypothetical protein
MNKPPQNTVQMPEYLKTRKLHLNGIIAGMVSMKKFKATSNKFESITIYDRFL